MEQTFYHVLLEGRTVGPYDRRTIVGMRIKKALTSAHVLVATDGTQLTVADLIGRRPPPFRPTRSGSFSVVHATYPASLLDVRGRGMAILRFKGEAEARVQEDVLRLAGRYRQGLRWKEGRVKIPRKDVAHVGVAGSQVELWRRNGRPAGFQRIHLELFTPEAARDLVQWFPAASPLPEPGAEGAAASRPGAASHGLWIAVGGAAVAVGLLLMVLLYPLWH